MGRSRSRRVLTVLSIIAAPTLAAAVVLPGVALAKGPPTTKGSCSSLSGNAAISAGPGEPTISGCTGIPGTTSGTFAFPFASMGSATITWNAPSGAKTVFSFKSKTTLPTKTKKGVSVPNPKFHCPPADTVEAALKGKIAKTGNSGFGTTVGGFKGAVKATVCVDSSFNISLLAGTSFTL